MSQFIFGAGSLWGTSTATGSTPIQFGALQEASFDFSATTKELFGGSQFALAVRRGTIKVTGKAKNGTVNGAMFNSLFFGQNGSVGQVLVANGETASIPATPYAITVSNASKFSEDLGVKYSLTGLPLTRVASAPTTGQYSVSNVGVYTFAAADTLLSVAISYSYTSTTGGTTTAITNQRLGTTPIFSMTFNAIDNGKQVTYTFPKCTASKLSFGTKLEDFVIPEFDFHVFADDSGQVCIQSTVE
jgi:hypothetical protein